MFRRPATRRYEVVEKTTPFRGFFRIDRYVVRHERHAGGMSEPISREVFERGHAAAALPYDPVRDEVVLIEQFRAGALAAGRDPWLIEPVAGIVEDGETTEDVIRREMREESGLEVLALEPIADVMMSPGGASESTAFYCAKIDAAGAGGIHGAAEEGEDIRVIVLPAEQAIADAMAGRADSAPGLITLFWLAANRERLRGLWGG